MPTMEIKTPVFKNERLVPAQLIGTAEGWIDPAEICAITSGVHIVPKVIDVVNNKQELLGGLFTVLQFKGGAKLLVFGTPKKIRQQRTEILAKLSQVAPPKAEPDAG